MKLVSLVFFIGITLPAYSQNLLLNGDFEMYDACPQLHGQLQVCKSWRNPNYTTSPDYFNNCDSTGTTKAGYAGPLNGAGYCGIVMFYSKAYSYREFIQGELHQPMLKGKRYRISMQVLLDSNSNYYTDVFSFGLSSEASVWSRMIKGYAGIFSNTILTAGCDSCLKIKGKWVTIHAEYNSRGGERFLTIGYFKDLYTKRKHAKMLRSHTFGNTSKDAIDQAYYYIDNVIVEEIN